MTIEERRDLRKTWEDQDTFDFSKNGEKPYFGGSLREFDELFMEIIEVEGVKNTWPAFQLFLKRTRRDLVKAMLYMEKELGHGLAIGSHKEFQDKMARKMSKNAALFCKRTEKTEQQRVAWAANNKTKRDEERQKHDQEN